jgi:hypothetical protein
LIRFDLFEHGKFERCNRWLCKGPPYIMPKEEETISMNIGFSDVEVGPDEGD